MAKKSERKKLKDELESLCRDIVRERADYTCEWCGRKLKSCPRYAHCSHVIPKKRGDGIRYDLDNLVLLCTHCHLERWHKDPIEAFYWYAKNYPAQLSYLRGRVRKGDLKKNFTMDELRTMAEKYKGILHGE